MNAITIHYTDGRIEMIFPPAEQDPVALAQLLQAAYGTAAVVKSYGPGDRVQIAPAPTP